MITWGSVKIIIDLEIYGSSSLSCNLECMFIWFNFRSLVNYEKASKEPGLGIRLFSVEKQEKLKQEVVAASPPWPGCRWS